VLSIKPTPTCFKAPSYAPNSFSERYAASPVKSSYFDRRPLQDITGILSSVGVDANNEKLVKMLSALEGKDLVEAAHHAI